MHIFFIFLTSLFIMTGCSKSTAFDPFKMDDVHERAVNNMRTATIVKNSEAKVIISAIYLNRTMPESYKDENGEYFLVALYQKNDSNLTTESINLTMNAYPPLTIHEVDKEDSLRSLMPINNEWNHYYLATYLVDEKETLSLTFESGLYGLAELTYRKDEQ
ncbi:MAG: hypothetical protein U9Q62_07585 [Campylobacterota bacterium]|nr:hypothetical protein [Campylobacterota bacterium]